MAAPGLRRGHGAAGHRARGRALDLRRRGDPARSAGHPRRPAGPGDQPVRRGRRRRGRRRLAADPGHAAQGLAGGWFPDGKRAVGGPAPALVVGQKHGYQADPARVGGRDQRPGDADRREVARSAAPRRSGARGAAGRCGQPAARDRGLGADGHPPVRRGVDLATGHRPVPAQEPGVALLGAGPAAHLRDQRPGFRQRLRRAQRPGFLRHLRPRGGEPGCVRRGAHREPGLVDGAAAGAGDGPREPRRAQRGHQRGGDAADRAPARGADR